MELWIPITIFAAFCQNLRSALQKHLKGAVGTTGATFIRFGYGFPFALLYVASLHLLAGYELPAVNRYFLMAAAFGGLAQIIATFLLVSVFSFRNFTVGTAYSKTEPVQAALFGLVLLGETVTLPAAVAIMTGVLGVILISLSKTPGNWRELGSALLGRPAMIGLASAAFFGASAAAYRVASLSLGGPGFLMQAAFSLACVTLFQTVVMATWMAWKEPDQLSASLRNWRPSIWVGFAGVAGSIGWFTAMTLQQVAYVRALAQIELVFTVAASWLFFRETLKRNELLGSCLIVLSVVAIILFR